jgi:hypothetical protein
MERKTLAGIIQAGQHHSIALKLSGFGRRFSVIESLAVRSQMLRSALIRGKMLAEPSLDEVPLLSRYHPVPLQAAVVFAVFRNHIRAVVGNAYQPCWIATFTVIRRIDYMAICWHKLIVTRIRHGR